VQCGRPAFPGHATLSAGIRLPAGVTVLPEFEIDWDREHRTGVPEAVLCEPKTPDQIAVIIDAADGCC
jgi:NCAIR mutase (PurE)-related protein